MISLFLDSCDKNIIVALLINNKVVSKYIENNDNCLSERFLPLIKKLFDDSAYELNDVDSIYIVNGPGSFTGTRIGVTTAKVIAWGFNKRIVPISELEVYASTYTDKENIISYIDARRDYFYAGFYDKNLNSIYPDKYMHKNDIIFEAEKLGNYIFVGYDNIANNSIIPNIDIEKVVEKHKNDAGINPHEVVPNYLKRTEAEEKNDRTSK